ncbi:hypothetical protein ACQ4PT_037799 [Festuca glaucescens]
MDESAKELLKHLQGFIKDSAADVTMKLSTDFRTRSDAVERTVEALSNDFHAWKPHMESRVDELQAAVVELQQKATLKQPFGVPTAPNGGGPAAAHLADVRGLDAFPLMGKRPAGTDLGQGHGESSILPGAALGAPTAPACTPAKGTANFQTPMHLRSSASDTETSVTHLLAHMEQANPSLQFPVFDGDNPQMWQTLAEQYFAMFAIHESYWVSMAILNFVGSPKIWLHSVHKKLDSLDWDSFCTLICTRFGRDRHQLLIRQFYTLKQTDTVGDYIERFETVMNNLIAYSDAIHPLYFLTRFIEGLRNDIWAVVMVQRPSDLDSACALALLQEEVADSLKPVNSRQFNPGYRNRQYQQPPAPNRPTMQNITNTVVDRRPNDPTRYNSEHGNKLQTLRDYRRARGLCFKCGEKWGRDHTCAATIQLHIVEELLEFMRADALGIHEDTVTAEPDRENLCLISLQALSDHLPVSEGSPTVLQLQGWVQGFPVTLLVDSRSTSSFINKNLQQILQGITKIANPLRVKVANDRE